MFKFLLRKSNQNKKQKEPTDKDLFNNIMSFANKVMEASNRSNYKEYFSRGNEHPILDLVRLIGRNLQTKYVTNLIYYEDESELNSLYPEEIFFDLKEIICPPNLSFYDLVSSVENKKDVHLNKDLVLPWPWKRERLINTISRIGKHRTWGEWKEDKLNHYIELWMPMGIAWVKGGNHSIATGIVQGVGKVLPKSTFDISGLYEYVYTDGEYYYRKNSDSIICKVKNIEFAALFEIGRIMKDNNISF
jgi:hypothetical protein